MKSIKRLMSLTLVIVMIFQGVENTNLGAATAKGTTLRLEATEGTVALKNSNGSDKTIKSGMKLYSGDTATTASKSYAYISLDSSKAVKMDENSAVSIKQNGTENEIMLSEGNLMFNVTVPLKKKESLNIRTSTMVTGVRGTIGVSKRISDDESVLYLLEGHTEVGYIDSKTRKAKTASVSAGELLNAKRVGGKKGRDSIISTVKLSKITEDDIDDFVVIEIGRNLDIQKRLREGGIFDVDKILLRYRKLGDTGKHITLGERAPKETVSNNSVTSGNSVTGNSVSSNKTEDTNPSSTSGTGGGGGGGGGGAAGNVNNGNDNGTNKPNKAGAPVVTIQSGNKPSSSYAINSVIPPLSVTAEVAGGTATVTYQWYRSDVAGELGNPIAGETNSSFTPPSDTLGTTYYTCVVTTKSDDAESAEKESEQYKITILKKNNISNISSPAAPDYENIGFNFITIPEVTTYTPAAASVFDGIGKDNSTIRIQSTRGVEKLSLILNEPAGTATIPEGSVIEYACVSTNKAPDDDSKWQTGRTFENLEAATTYYCFSRAGATDDTAASEPSSALEVATKGGEEVSYFTDEHIEYRVVSENGVYTAACGFEYHPDKTGVGNKYFNYSGDIIIPSVISCYGMDDIPVTEVFESGFFADSNGGNSHCNSFYNGKVIIPDSVKVIGDKAFYGLSGMDGIELGSGIEKIGDAAFYNAYVLFDGFPAGLKEIGKSAFAGTAIYEANLPEGLEKLGDGAFMNCQSLRTVTLPSTLKEIGSGLFLNCNNLTEATLPEGITSVSSNAFMNCESLQSITLPETVTEIGNQAFYNCGRLTTVNIPQGVHTIGESAFFKCVSLGTIDLPNSLKVIGPQAFAYSGLTGITIPDGVKTLDYGTFKECVSLTDVYLPSSLERIVIEGKKGQTGDFHPFLGCTDNLTIYYPGSSIPAGFSEEYNWLTGTGDRTATVTLNYVPGSP